MFKSITTLSLLLGVLMMTTTGCFNSSGEQTIDYEDDVKPLIETTDKMKIRGSCNFISDKSSCVDFIGEIFTEERMKLSCEEGTFSFNTCPYSELGGCRATPNTISESIVWSYGYGGQPISPEEAGYQARACNSLSVSEWVMPDDLLGQ